MANDAANVLLLGFEKDSGLGEMLAQFGVREDYRVTLPAHIREILNRQFPDVLIESIELLDVPKCNLGGMQQEGDKTLVRIQMFDVTLELCVILRVARGRFALDIQLVIRCVGLDSQRDK
jgi:hypothetical protein